MMARQKALWMKEFCGVPLTVLLFTLTNFSIKSFMMPTFMWDEHKSQIIIFFKPYYYGEPEIGEIEIISGEYPELEGECVQDTHFGDIIFYPLGEFSFPVTSIDTAVASDADVSDLTTCQKQCVSYAGCYQGKFFYFINFCKKTYSWYPQNWTCLICGVTLGVSEGVPVSGYQL